MKRLTVRADSRTYPILVGRDVLGRLGAEVRRLRGDGQVVVLCDENVAPLYLERARTSLREAGLSTSHVILPGGRAREEPRPRRGAVRRAVRPRDAAHRHPRHPGRRGHRRPRRVRRLHVSSGLRLRAGADDAAGAGRRVRGRQGRRRFPRRQELRGHLLPAEPGARRPARAPHAPCEGTAQRRGRGRQARTARRRRGAAPRGAPGERRPHCRCGHTGARRRLDRLQGVRGGARRARGRPARRAQLRTHHRARDRGRDRVPALVARGGRGSRPARRPATLGRARRPHRGGRARGARAARRSGAAGSASRERRPRTCAS